MARSIGVGCRTGRRGLLQGACPQGLPSEAVMIVQATIVCLVFRPPLGKVGRGGGWRGGVLGERSIRLQAASTGLLQGGQQLEVTNSWNATVQLQASATR